MVSVWFILLMINGTKKCCYPKKTCCCVTTRRVFSSCKYTGPRFQWPRVLKRGYVAAHLLECRFESTGIIDVFSCVCCCFLVEVRVTIWSLVQRSPIEFGVFECDLETSTVMSPRSTRTDESWKHKYRHKRIIELPITFYLYIPVPFPF